MDNPFIGLDADTRQQLRVLLGEIAQKGQLQLILILSKTDDIPPFITHVVEVDHRIVRAKVTLDEYLAHRQPMPDHVLSKETAEAILNLPYTHKEYNAREVARLNKVSIRYGKRTILKDLDWVVGNGEHWALSGQNGAGKSTLLSLICADNPQSYACDITLFDMPRGTVESIWDITQTSSCLRLKLSAPSDSSTSMPAISHLQRHLHPKKHSN